MSNLLAIITDAPLMSHDQIMYCIYGAIAVAIIALVRESLRVRR
jgi:hypothetical protein